MSQKRIVLGLDIGVGSVGWGLVKIQEEAYPDEKSDGSVETRHKIIGGEIIAAGVRTFQPPQDRQNKSLALHRGSKRRSRRTIRRKARRLKRLIQLGKEFDLIPEDFDRDQALKPKPGDKENTWDIWFLRNEALERKLEDIELFRILYHIAKHRGFYFHTKAEELEEGDSKSEEGRAKAGLRDMKRLLQESGYKTIGQMFWETFNQRNTEEAKRQKRNAKDQYGKSVKRLWLKDEIEIIFETQQKLGNNKAKEELARRYIEDILMKEKGIDDQKLQNMMSRCEFEKDEYGKGKLCAPKESYTAERFTLFNRLNTLVLNDTQTRSGRLSPEEEQQNKLKKEQRDKIAALAYKKTKVTFSQIRKELEFEDQLHLRFNICSYAEKNPEYSKKLYCEVKDGRLQFDESHKVKIVAIETGEVTVLDEEIKRIFRGRKFDPKAKKIHVYYSDIRKQLNLSDAIRFAELKGYTKSAIELEREAQEKAVKRGKALKGFDREAAYLKQFEDKDIFVELKGYHKIKKAMEGCGDGQWDRIRSEPSKLDVIAEALTYCKSDKTRKKYLKDNGITDERVIEAVLTINMKQLANHSKEAMRNLLKHMEEGKLFNEAKEECGYGKTEYDKQSILKPYSGFFDKNPVVARVISQTRKLVNAIVRKYGETYPIDQIHIEVSTELASSDKLKTQISLGQRRYKEEKEAARIRCQEFGLNPEEGQNLLMFRLAEQQRYRCPYTNQAIVLRATGAENEVCILDCEIDHIIPMSRSFNDSMNNKVLCAQKANQEKRDRIPYEWFEAMYGNDSRQWYEFERRVKKLYGMPYPKRVNLLRKRWKEEDEEKFISRNLNDTRYAARHIADYLRRHFDFSRSGRDDIKEDRRIQLRSGGVTAFLRHMWGLNKIREENDLHHALDALVVACSTNGHVYLVSNLAKEIERKGKNWYKHFGRDKFKPWDTIREDIENSVGDIFVSRMPRHTVTSGAHKENPDTFKTKPKKPLKEQEKKQPKHRYIEVNDGYAEMGDMVRADIFVDERGKNYVVPIYAVDIFSNKPFPDKYMNKSASPYDEWPNVTENALEFKFSIFKDDLISIDGDFYYVDFVGGTRSNISVRNVDGSKFESTNSKERDFGYRNVELKKFSVDLLGTRKEIKREKRLGNRFENKKSPSS